MRTTGLIRGQCNDAADVVTPFNGSALLAKTVTGERVVNLHKRCEGQWADKNNCETLVPLKMMRRSGNSVGYIEARKTASFEFPLLGEKGQGTRSDPRKTTPMPDSYRETGLPSIDRIR
jgi:hypothetical protein